MSESTALHGSTKPDWLSVLQRAQVVTFGPVGVAAVRPPELEAYEEARASAQREPTVFRTKIDALLREGTPAARVYAAFLLEQVDPEAARAVFAALASDTTKVTHASGCMVIELEMRAALELLRKPPAVAPRATTNWTMMLVGAIWILVPILIVTMLLYRCAAR